MIELFVKRPVMTVMFILVFVVMGVVSFFKLTIESAPKVEFPLVFIRTVYPGASPVEIETQIIKKIEDAIAELSGIDKIQSTAFENYGFIMIEFSLSSDVNIKSIEVKDRVEAILNDLPREAEKPVIAKFDPTVTPIIELILSSTQSDELRLYEFADKNIKNILNVIEGVASTDIFGGKKRQLNVKLDSTMMKKHYVGINDIISDLKTKNMNVPGGSIGKTHNETNVRMIGEFKSIDDISNMTIVTKEGKPIRLSEIAIVEDSYKKVDSITRYNGQNVVGLSIKKLSDGDSVEIGKRVRRAISEIKLPEDMSLKIAFDSTEMVLKETYSTINNIFLGIILTVIILFLFMGNLRVTIIASVVIPSSIVSSFLLMDFSNFTINMMTLLAMATALGTLIANAVVIIESIMARIDKGENSEKAAIGGTKEAMVAVLASAGTNLVVFSPIAFMGGIVGQFMKQFGLTVVYATIFSIIASFSLTPMLCAFLFKKNYNINFSSKIKKTVNNFIELILKEYRYLFDFIVSHKWITTFFIILCFVSLLYPLKYTGGEFFSSFDRDIIRINVNLPQGVSLDRTNNVVKQLESIVSEFKEVASYLSFVGKDGLEKAQLIVNLIPRKKRSMSDIDIINSMIPIVANIPDAEINFTGMAMGDNTQGDISINVKGSDYNKMIKISREMTETMKDSGYFRSIDSSYKTPSDEIIFIPDEEKIIEYGLKNSDIGGIIRTSIAGNDTNLYKEHGEEYRINVELHEEYKKSIDDIKNIGVVTKSGIVPLSNLGEVKTQEALPAIKRRDKVRIIQLNGYLSKSTSEKVQKILDEEFKKIDFPEGYGYAYTGTAEFMKETQAEIFQAFILAVVLTYMLLAAILNSYLAPFVIVTSVATSFIAVIYFLFFAEFSINIGSMMAMVMLVGLAVNNAILIVDRAIFKLKSGVSVNEAIWSGVSGRFRTVFMTSFAIVFGAFPQVFDPNITKAAIGGVIVGGMLGSTIFTFLFIPVVFSVMTRIQKINFL